MPDNRTYVVDVELLGKRGGGRTYSYRYNLHYKRPVAGAPVIVPFGHGFTPAMVTAACEAGGRDAERLRPVLGTTAGCGIARLCGTAWKTMNAYLRPAGTALALFLPGSLEREIGLFFFARRLKQF